MNIREVAKLARVSTATVSRTMNGSTNVHPEKAQRVFAAIKELNFYPNITARTLGTGQSRIYGLIISDITNPFFPEIVRSFEDIAVKHGQEVLIANTGYDAERMELCVRRMLERKVDGVAIMTSEMHDHLIQEMRCRVPLVFLDTGSAGQRTSNISLAYSAGVEKAVTHIASLGHTRVGFISGPPNLVSAMRRRAAFLHSLLQHGLSGTPALIEEGDHRIEGGFHAMQRLLAGAVLPTCVLCSNDLTAIGAIFAIQQSGRRVPEDISVVGFDDIDISRFTHPPLTTVRVSRSEIAEKAFEALWNTRGQSDDMGLEFEIALDLVVRGSTAPVRGDAHALPYTNSNTFIP